MTISLLSVFVKIHEKSFCIVFVYLFSMMIACYDDRQFTHWPHSSITCAPITVQHIVLNVLRTLTLELFCSVTFGMSRTIKKIHIISLSHSFQISIYPIVVYLTEVHSYFCNHIAAYNIGQQYANAYPMI